jgi:hypothetical protein
MAEKQNKDEIKNSEQLEKILARQRSAREQYNTVTQNILKTEQQLFDLQQNEKDNLDQIIELLEKKEKLENAALKLEEKNKEYIKNEKKFLDSRKKSEEESEKRRIDAIRYGKTQEEIEGRISDLTINLTKELSRQRAKYEQLNDNARKMVEQVGAASVQNKMQNASLNEAKTILESQGYLTRAYVSSLEEGNARVKDQASLEREIVSQVNEAAVGKYKSVDLTDQILDINEQIDDISKGRLELTELEKQNALDILASQKDSFETLMRQNAVLVKMSKDAEKVLGVFDKMTTGDFKGALLQQFGLDDINKEVKTKLGASIVNVVKQVKEGDLAGAFTNAAKALWGMIKSAPKLAMALGIGGILALGTFLIDLFVETDKEVAQLGRDFGITKDAAKGLHHVSTDVANEMKIVGIHSEEVSKSLKTVSDNLGGIDLTKQFKSGNEAVKQLVKDTAVLTEQFGLSGEEISNMQGLSAITGKSMGALSMSATTLGKGVFTAKESMKILAGIPKTVAIGMRGNVDAMIKMSQQAKLLGLDLKKVEQIGMGTLEIEDSLGKEMEARVLTGRNINLDAMREASLRGDTGTVMRELVKNAGTLDEFSKMGPIQQKALADAMGMSREEMTDMLTKQKELEDAGMSYEKAQQLQGMNQQDLAKELSKTNDAQQRAYIEKIAKEKESASTQEKMADLMKRMQSIAVKLIEPIMDVVDGLFQGSDGADSMGGILNSVGTIVKAIAPIIKAIATTIGAIVKPLISILGMFSSTEAATHGVANTTEKISDGVSGATDKTKSLLSGFGGILTIVTSIGAFFTGKALLGKGIDLIKGKAASLGNTLLSKVSEPLGKVGSKLLGGGKEKTMPKIGGAEKSLDKMSSVTDKAKSMGDKIKDFGKGLGSAMASIGKGFGSGVKAVLKGLGEGIVGFLKPMKALADPTLILGVIVFTGAMIGLGYAFKLLGEGIGAAAPGIKAFFEGVGGIVQKVGEAIATVIETITTSVIRLQEIDGAKLAKGAFGIMAISGALAAFGGGSAIAGLGSALGKFFDEDPIDKFNRFASINGDSLFKVAQAINVLGQSLQSFSNISSNLNLGKVDEMVSKIEKLKEAQTSAAISDLGTQVVGGLTSFVGGIFGSNEKQAASPVASTPANVNVSSGPSGADMSNVEKKLDTLITLFGQAASQPTVIKFGDRVVDEIKTQLNFKKAYNVKIDNTYGRALQNG